MRRGLRDVGWVSASLGIRQALAFISTVIAGRVLSVEEFSTYLLAVSATVVLIPVADGGMWAVVTRVASRRPREPLFAFAAAAFRKRVIVWLLLVAGSAAIIPFAGLRVGAVLVIAALGAIGQANLDSMCGELFGRRRFAAGAALRIASGVIGLVGMAVLIFAPRTAVVALVPFALARVLPALIAAIVVRPHSLPTPQISWRVSYKFALSSVLIVAYVRSDLFLLSLLGASSQQIATYGALYNVLIAIQLLPSSLAAAVYPRIAAAHPENWQSLVTRSTGASFIISTVTCAGLSVYPSLSLLIFGSKYAAHVGPVRLLLLAIVPMSFSQLLIAALQGRDRESTALRLVILTAVMNIAGNLLLIPLLGPKGATIATFTAECVAGAGCIILTRIGLEWRRALPPSAAILLAAIACVTNVSSVVVSALLLLSVVLALMTNWFLSRSSLDDLLQKGRLVTLRPEGSG